jgi:exopolysaccharide biosynthesis polyprenyl glycosylphosphotransferase
MSIRTVAIDRDVRAPARPTLARLFSDTALRRALRVTVLVIIDACCLFAAILVASSVGKGPWGLLWPSLSWWEVALQVGILVVVAGLYGLYGRRLARHDLRKVLSAWIVAFIVTLVLTLLIDQDTIGARYVAAWILGLVLDLGGRAGYDALAGLLPNRDQGPAALLLGTRASCRVGMQALRSLPPASQVDVRGLLLTGDSRPAADDEPLPDVLGTDGDLVSALAATGATQVVIADPDELNGRLRTVMETCAERGVALNVVAPGLPAAEHVTYIPGLDCPLFVVIPRPASTASYVAKAVLDRVLSALLLVVLSPLLLGIAIAVKVSSRGPVFFTDERVGVGQRTCRCYKFRTMVRDARETQAELEEKNEAGDVLFKIRDDPRVTPVGRFLRRTSLDELPQLWNVLKGDMSLVGPRPLPLRDCDLMEDSHHRRHVMKPGITGLWQVSGRSDLSFDEMVRLDLKYMETWSLRSDAYIVWRTLGAVVRTRGAY